ncbi:MAG: hypothetical protein JWN84_1526 [Nocardioides sp.]|nr:hypothetical protein [Nocardioides sp.]
MKKQITSTLAAAVVAASTLSAATVAAPAPARAVCTIEH